MRRHEHAVVLSFLILLGFAGASADAQSVGSTFAIANTAQAEMSGGAAFDGTNYLVAIQGDSSDSHNISVQFVSPTGTLVGSRISIGRTGGIPRVAFDSSNYLLVWSDGADHQVYGLSISPGGQLGSPFAITSGAGTYEPQGLAYDGVNYLVLYSDAQSGPFNLYGQFISVEGSKVGNPLTLATNACGTFQGLAWNGSTYLVAWPAHTGDSQNIVQGRTVSQMGVMSSVFTIDSSVSLDQNPLSVGSDGTNFLVVWNYDASRDTQGYGIWELRGQVVTPTGTLSGSMITVADTTTRPILPAVGFDGATYLVAWTAYNGTDFDVIGQYYRPNGTTVGSAFGIATGSGGQGLSPLCFANGQYLAVWADGFNLDPSTGVSGGDVKGAFLTPPLVITSQPGSQAVNAAQNATFSVAASGNPSPGYKWQFSSDGGSTWSDLTDTGSYSGTTTANLNIASVTASLSRYQFHCLVSNTVGTVTSSAAVLRVAPTTTTFSGSDDFSSNTNWSVPTRIVGGGDLTFTNGRLEFTVNPPSADDAVFREWTANVGSYTQNWSVQVAVHVASLDLQSSNQHANLNLIVGKAADALNSIEQMNRIGISMDRYGDSLGTMRQFEGDLSAYSGGVRHWTGFTDKLSNATDGILRITFDSATKVLASWYSTDGTNWTQVQTVDISTGDYNWNMTDSDTFALVLAGGSGNVTLNSGDAYYGSFQASTGSGSPSLTITTQPQSQSVAAGADATFTVAVSGDAAPTFQWQVSSDSGDHWTDLTNTTPYSGVTTPALTVSAATTALSRYQFHCVVTGSTSGSVTSNAALLHVAPLTTTLSGSDDFSNSNDTNWSALTRLGGTTASLAFSNSRLEYTVTSPSQEDIAMREWTADVGSYTQDWTVQVDVHLVSPSLADGQRVNLNLMVVKAADALNSKDQMNRMGVSVDRYGNGSTTVSEFEGNLVAYSGGSAQDTGLMDVPSAATDASLRITFNSATKELSSWYSTDGSTWTVLQTVNIGSGTYAWNMADSDTFAVALAGGSGGITLGSGDAYFDNFQARSALTITTQPQSQSVATGANATFTVAANSSSSLTYQWQVSADSGDTWTDLTNTAPYSGVTTATLTVTAATTALSRYQFQCVVSSTAAGSVNSDAAVLRVAPTAATFSGSDDFSNSNDTNWSALTRLGGTGAVLAFANGRLEYTISSPSPDDIALREWTANVGSYTQDWFVQADVRLAPQSLSNNEHASLELVVIKSADAISSKDQMNRMGVGIDRWPDPNGMGFGFESDAVAYYDNTNHEPTHLEIFNAATDAALRITFNSTTKELTSWYSTDHVNWTLLQTLNIGSGTYTWNMTDSSTFAVALVGGTGGITLNSGDAYFDNFQATVGTPPETIGGTVCTDPANPGTSGLTGATVTVAGTGSTSGTLTTTTGAQGAWQLTGVPVGTYSVTPSKTGYTFQHVTSGAADGQAAYAITVDATHRTANQSIQFQAFPVPTKLAFATPPAGPYTAGATFSVQVAVQDATSHTVTASTASVTLALGQNPGSATLSGTVTQAAVNGVATFTGLSLNKAGTGYTLAASSTGLTGATSDAFNITAGTPAKLAFTTQPGNGGNNGSLTHAPVVGVYDALDNLVANSNVSVTLQLAGTPADATLSGTNPVTADATGLATFSGLSVNRAGTYTLSAAATGLTGATSSSFTVGGLPQLTLAKTHGVDPVDANSTVTYTVTYGNSGSATATNVVIVETLPAGLTYVSATGSPVYSATAKTVTWTIGTLAVASTTQTVTFTARVDAALRDGGTILNSALVIRCTETDPVQAAVDTTHVRDKQGPTITPIQPLANATGVSLRPSASWRLADNSGVDCNTVKIYMAGDLIYNGAAETAAGVYDSNTVNPTQKVRGVCRRTGTATSYTFAFVPAATMQFSHEQHVSVVVDANDTVHNPTALTYAFTTLVRTFGKNARVNSDTGTLVQDNPATAADAAGNIWVVWDQTNAAGDTDIYAGRLPYGASAFQGSVPVAATANNESHPALAVDANGVAYAAWQTKGASGYWDIYCSSSADGTTWSSPVKVSVGDVNNTSDQTVPVIAVAHAPSKTVYVAWQDMRSGHADVWLGTSTDRGQTWTETQISQNTTGATEPVIAVDPNNVVYVAWTDARNTATTGTDIYGASSDGGWTNMVLVNAPGDQSRPVGVAGAAGTVNLAWVSGTAGVGNIMYAQLSATTQPPVTGVSLIDAGEPNTVQQAPTLAVHTAAGTTTVYAAWQDGRNVVSSNQDTDIYFAEGSPSFGTNLLVNDDQGKYTQAKPALGVDKTGAPYLVWVDNRGGNKDIYYAGTTGIGAPLPTTVVTHPDGAATVRVITKPNLDVNVPSNALPPGVEVNDISIAQVSNPPEPPAAGFGVCYNFGPDGTQFATPVTIKIPLDANAPVRNVYRVYFYDQAHGVWSEDGIHNPAQKVTTESGSYLLVQVDHFSEFQAGGVTVTAPGGGGGGGCALAPWSHADPVAYGLPFAVYVLVLLGVTYFDRLRRRAGTHRRQP